MFNLSNEVKLFFLWWKRELSFLVPIKIRQFFYAPRTVILIRPKGEKFELSYDTGGVQKHLATISRNIASTEAIKPLILKEECFKNAVFILRLSEKEALNKTLNLPLAAQANVSQVVSYELDRYSPFKADQVYYTTRLDRIDKEAAQVIVQLLLVPRKLLETFYNDCKNLGMTPEFVEVENCPNDLKYLYKAYNLLPSHLQPKIGNSSRHIMRGLVVSSILMCIASLILPVWLEYIAVENLQNQIAKIEKEVNIVKNLQLSMNAISDENQSLINEKTVLPSVVSILNEISKLMTDTSWLAYLQYSDGQLQLQGESPTASNLLADLEASHYFANVSFASPVTQDKASGMERFQITAEITKPADLENSDATIGTTIDPIIKMPNGSTVKDEITKDEVNENVTPEE